MQVIGVFNRDGGTFRTLDLSAFCAKAEAAFARNGDHLTCRVVSGPEIEAALVQAAGEVGEGVLLAGGGDGTISRAAEIAFSKGVVLAVLPAGTMNLFARTLGLPPNLDQALEAIAAGVVRPVDVATANGRLFVHQFGVGIHARLVRIRESLSYRSRWGKMLASVRAILRAMLHPPDFEVEITSLRGVERRRISGLAVTNNPPGEGHIPYADRLDQGVLGVYLAKPVGSWAMMRLAIAVGLGRWRTRPEVLEREVKSLVLRFPHIKRSAQAVIDGELAELEPVVALKILPGALRVVMPSWSNSAFR